MRPLIHPRQREQHRAAEDIKNDSIDDQHTRIRSKHLILPETE